MSAPPTFPPAQAYQPLIALARDEDLGPGGDDVTSRLLIPPAATATATLLQKSPGVIAGLPLVPAVCAAYDPALTFTPLPVEATFSATPRPLGTISGPLPSLLSAERILLNFLQHLSGIATLTHRFVTAVAGTRAQILDTRKTLPAYRALAKYAVRAGAGHNHRIGLYDGLLVKDNHLARIPPGGIAGFLGPVVAKARGEDPGRLIEVEVDTLAQLDEVLEVAGVDVVLLDNMPPEMMHEAVRRRSAAGSGTLLEASGGVNLATVRAIAETGVDRISVGALTHSAPALDIGLDVHPQVAGR